MSRGSESRPRVPSNSKHLLNKHNLYYSFQGRSQMRCVLPKERLFPVPWGRRQQGAAARLQPL